MEPELNTILLSVIAVLMSVCAYFLSRMVTKFDALETDVAGIRQSFLLFRQRVSMLLEIDDDDDGHIPAKHPTPKKA
jgi:hypothetical protein